MASAPVLGSSKTQSLDDAIFAVEVQSHLVHEAVRAEANARRSGTSQTKSRGLVSGGRAKPWRQKGTGRARAGTVRAPQFEGGGHAFAKTPRSFDLKVNRKVARAAMRSALAAHVNAGSLVFLDAGSFGAPSTKAAAAMVEELARPIVVVCNDDEVSVGRSFRNLDRVAVVQPSELEVGAIVWANSLVVSEAALSALEGRAR